MFGGRSFIICGDKMRVRNARGRCTPVFYSIVVVVQPRPPFHGVRPAGECAALARSALDPDHKCPPRHAVTPPMHYVHVLPAIQLPKKNSFVIESNCKCSIRPFHGSLVATGIRIRSCGAGSSAVGAPLLTLTFSRLGYNLASPPRTPYFRPCH